MKITKSRLGEIARSFLGVLDREKISSLDDLKNNCGRTFEIFDLPRTFIELGSRPADFETTAYRASYIIHLREGVPIEVVVNEGLGYLKLFIKSKDTILGYEPGIPSLRDGYGNMIQHKKVITDNLFPSARKELEELAKL